MSTPFLLAGIYEYAAANRLTKVISGSLTIDYAYDGWGNLIQESSNGVTTEYMLDESSALPRVLGEVRSDGTERLYAYGPEGFAAQMTVGGGIEYPLLDGLGSLRQLTDNNGAIVLYRSYDAFGTIRGSGGTSSSRLGYTGELQDTATGLVYLRARHYHPVLSRFLQRDSFAGSIARGQSLNRYSYTENNPTNLTDPSGHCPWCLAAGIGAGAGALMEYGGQVYQNYSDGQRGADMFRPRDWGNIGQAAVAGGVGGLTGFYLGPAAAGLARFGSPLLNSIAAGALEGAGSGALSQIAKNLMRGCAWNNDLLPSLAMGGLGGGLGGAVGWAARKIKPISLLGFRGAGRGGEHYIADGEPLIYAGHVGISFDRGKTIYGFTPYAPGMTFEKVVSQLKQHTPFPGVVADDTQLFHRAQDLFEQGLERTQVYESLQHVSLRKFDQIRNAVLDELASSPLDGKRYTFPGGPIGCYNCSTWPASHDIQLPHHIGELRNYIPALAELGKPWMR